MKLLSTPIPIVRNPDGTLTEESARLVEERAKALRRQAIKEGMRLRPSHEIMTDVERERSREAE